MGSLSLLQRIFPTQGSNSGLLRFVWIVYCLNYQRNANLNKSHVFLGTDQSDIEWFALDTNRDHSVVFEIASKYCISDSFADHDGHSISSEGFLPAVVDIMVI